MEFLNEATYVDQAEKVIQALKATKIVNGREIKPQLVTTSKIRNILSMAADIYDNALQSSSNELGSDITSRIEYLRVRVVYECGRDNDRDKPVQAFVKESRILDYIKMIGSDKKKYIMFYRYLEALVAFHKFYGGKD